MCSTCRTRPMHVSAISRQFQGPVLRCGCPNSSACSLPCGRAGRNRLRYGCFGRSEYLNEREQLMRNAEFLPVIAVVLALATSAQAQDIDWKKVDSALGRPATVAGDVHRYGFPRSDLQVTLDGVTIRPALALGGWAAF